MGFSRQEYRSGLPTPSPADLHNPGIEPESPALAGRFFATEPSGKPQLEILELTCITNIFPSVSFSDFHFIYAVFFVKSFHFYVPIFEYITSFIASGFCVIFKNSLCDKKNPLFF